MTRNLSLSTAGRRFAGRWVRSEKRFTSSFPIYTGSVLLAFLLLPANHSGVRGQATTPGRENLPPLSAGEQRKGAIPGLFHHLYPIHLQAGQYLKVTITQHNMNMYVRFFDPTEIEIAQVDRDEQGPNEEVLESVVEQSGDYTLAVTANDPSVGRAEYLIHLVEVRAATPREMELAKAERWQCESQSHRSKGRYDAAIAPALKSLELRKGLLSEDDFDYADIHNHLGNVYREAGDFVSAQPHYERAKAIWMRTLRPDHPHIPTVLSNIGLNYQGLGDFDKAESMHRESLALAEGRVGPNHRKLLAPLNNLAIALTSKKKFEEAENLYRRLLEIFEAGKTISDNMAAAYGNFGAVLLAMGKTDEAEAALKRSLEIYDQRRVDPKHHRRGLPILTLATVYFKRGDYQQAEANGLKALEIFENSLRPEHPNLIEALVNLSATYRAMGNTENALATRERSSELREKNLLRNLTIGSERQKLATLTSYSDETNDTLSMHAHFAPNDPEALQLALTSWLRWKGRAMDELGRSFGSLRRDAEPEVQTLFQELAGKLGEYSRLAPLPLGEKERAALKRIDEEIERIQAELSRRSARFRSQTQPITIEEVQRALPPGSSLVEFVRYAPVDARTRKQMAPHYLAYTLAPEGPPQWVELGDAGGIDEAVRQWLEALRDRRVRNHRQLARNLDRLVMQPVRARIGAARRVFISTDGSLNLIPFAALVDERDRELVKDYLFVYLTSGRDLLRLQIKQSGNDDSFIFAGPSFDATREDLLAAARLEDRTRDIVKQKGDGNGPGQIVQSPRLDQISFTPLPGATEEAGALRKLLPEARMFTGLQALESELKLVSRPRLLHIATHGFFLKDPGSTSPSAGARTDKASPAAQSFEARVIENPLLRSGLALAGANNRKSVVDGTDDGILTAMEAAGLDLWGTKLVVLSACDTGVGEVRNGDGVYGLRRAFVLAGSETQVMSLWSVSDQGTKELMVDYYKRLLRGEGRGEALRRVQLRMLKNPKRRHPFYWASFIQSGEWANLDGKR